MNKLEIKNIVKAFGEKEVTSNIYLTLENGVYGLLGPNGAGKTTLMKQITTLLKPDSGTIYYDGKDVFENESEYRAKLGYLPQDFEGYSHFTAQDFLLYMAALKGIEDSKKRVKEMLSLVGLESEYNKKVGKFSGGMKRRLGIAQALLNNPEILILDEPTAGLDPQERARFRNLISQISGQKIVILSTHIISDIESIAKETILMRKGRIMKKGNHKEIMEDMKGKVFTIFAKNEEESRSIESKYKVVNIHRLEEGVEFRVITESRPEDFDFVETEPKFEDVYMFYFDLENNREA